MPVNKDPLWIGVLQRDKGMAYTFKENVWQKWSWRQMLASFSDTTRAQILGGGENAGVVSIALQAIKGSYDHKRRHAAKDAGEPYPEAAPVPIWDFVVERTDGSEVRFHTQQTNRKVEISSVLRTQTDPPTKGR